MFDLKALGFKPSKRDGEAGEIWALVHGINTEREIAVEFYQDRGLEARYTNTTSFDFDIISSGTEAQPILDFVTRYLK